MSGSGAIIFVYGTLKPGFPNAHAMPKDSRSLGEGVTEERFPLVIEPRTGVPFLLPADERAHKVKGHLYQVTGPGLSDLDAFEGVDIAFYERRSIAVRDSSDNVVIAEAYFRHPDGKGPSWALPWTIWRLRERPLLAEYKLTDARGFLKRGER